MINNSGDINVSGATGDTRLQDTFGNINVTGLAAASVVATNNSGDITLRFATVPRQVNVTDRFGNVTLVLPRAAPPTRCRRTTRSAARTCPVPRSPTATT